MVASNKKRKFNPRDRTINKPLVDAFQEQWLGFSPWEISD